MNDAEEGKEKFDVIMDRILGDLKDLQSELLVIKKKKVGDLFDKLGAELFAIKQAREK